MPKVFKSITRLIYYSNGGFSYSELYGDVPVYVRRFLIQEIEDIKKKEKKAMEGEDTSGGTASSEDIGKAMEEMRKKAPESTGDAEKDLKKVFGPKEDRKRRDENQQRGLRQNKPEQQEQEQKQTEEETDEDSPPEADPAKADDLEQMIDKLKQDI